MDNYNHIYFMGIGGISMSGLAELMLSQKKKVSGSDNTDSELIHKLVNNGATVFIGQKKENITSDIDLIVYTSAISEDNEEFVRAKELGIPMLDRAEFLGKIMKTHHEAICVSGTHGKTTTTGMLSSILINTKLNPTIFLGGELDVIGGNIKIGTGDLLLTEACEYKRNFLKFYPSVGIILNIDEDHLDYYKDLNDIESAFEGFADRIPQDGALIVNNKHKDLFTDKKCKVITFGLTSDADIYAINISYNPTPKFEVIYKGESLGFIELSIYGEHNILNSLAAIASCLHLNIDLDTIKTGLKLFKGTKRRYEYKGTVDGVTVIDDYAHHPEEMIATFKTARKYTNGKIITIFQPHTYSRTYSLLDRFAEAFRLSDESIILDIYAAREKDTGLVSSETLVRKMKEKNITGLYARSFEEAANTAKFLAEPGDIIITMGAGNVNEIDKLLLQQ